MPSHYYTSVPDYSWLRANKKFWQGRASLAGVHWDLDGQLEWLGEVCSPHVPEIECLGWGDFIASSGLGQGYGYIEAQVLHAFVRSERPKTVVEIGSGASTAVMLRASQSNIREGLRGTEIVAVEPFPKPALKGLEGIVHIEEMCQKVPPEVFGGLDAGDLLFIDSSHAVKTGSEVLRIYLEIIPRLEPGVFIHIHDIYLPYLYTRTALSDYFDWQETSLALALLTDNPRLSVLCCQSALHYDRPAELSKILPAYRPQGNDEGLRTGDTEARYFPSSLWLKTR